MTNTLTREQRTWRWRIFAITWLAYAGFYLCRKNFSVCMPMLAHDLGYTTNDFALVISLFSLMYALGQFYNGILSDRFGPRIVVTIGQILAAFTSIVMGFGHVYAVFLVMCTLNGIGQSTGWSGTVKNMATWFRRHERGVVMGFWCTCYSVGGFIATNLATWAATNTLLFPQWGWRRGFWFPAIGLAVVSVLYATFTRNKPSDVGLPDFPEDDGSPATPSGSGDANGTNFRDVFKEVFSKRIVWITGSTYFLVKMTRYVFIFWLPLYMTDSLGYSDQEAGYTSSMYELIGFTGVIAAGFISDKLFGARRFPVVSLMLYGLAVACLMHPFLAAMGKIGNILGISLIGIMTFGPDATMSGPAAQDIGSQRGAAMATGIINGMGSFGQVVSPWLVAFMTKTRFGWNGLFYIFVLFALISATSMATLWNYGGKKS